MIWQKQWTTKRECLFINWFRCIKSLCEITMTKGNNLVSPVPCYPMYGIYGKILVVNTLELNMMIQSYLI